MKMNFPPKVDDPTPEEIAERSAEIRKGWTPDMHKKRARWAYQRAKTLFMSERFFDSFGKELDE